MGEHLPASSAKKIFLPRDFGLGCFSPFPLVKVLEYKPCQLWASLREERGERRHSDRWVPSSGIPPGLLDLMIWLQDSSLHALGGQLPLHWSWVFVIGKPTIIGGSSPGHSWLWKCFLILMAQEERCTCGVCWFGVQMWAWWCGRSVPGVQTSISSCRFPLHTVQNSVFNLDSAVSCTSINHHSIGDSEQLGR